MKKVLALLTLLITSYVTAFAQFGQSGGIIKPATWSVTVKPTSAKVGDVVTVQITATVKDGYHVYSSVANPKIDGPLPTVVTFKKNNTFALVGKLTPASKVETKFDDIFGGDTYIMHGRAVFNQKIKVLTNKPILAGTIESQACTDADGSCIILNEDFTVAKLTITAPTSAIKAAPRTVSPKPAAKVSQALTTEPAATTATERTDTAVANVTAQPIPDTKPAIASAESQALSTEKTADSSLLGFIIAAFLSGLVALATPCVFPIIPMTVSFFTNQKGGMWKALLYGFSIIAIYVLVGVLVSRINGPGFANFVSTHWFPNLLFFAVFFVFALSFLGLFEITLPNSLINRADAQSERGGIGGIFFMAFTLVLVSFSCTGPLVGSLLVASAGGEVIKPIIGMAAFSSAFAIPFTVFAAFPQFLKSLPKSGSWLNSVKVVLGFLELALALKFLSIADQVYHWGLLDRDVFLAIWIVLFALIGFYLLGKIRLPHDSETKTVSIPRLLLAIGTFGFVVYMIPGLWGAPLKGLAGYLPPETSQDFNLFARTNEPANAAPMSIDEPVKHADLFKLPRGLEGFFDYKQALAYAKKVNKPVFIDFTGHGCVNCREMEARVWSDATVMQRFRDDYVIVALYVDDKTELPESQWYTSPYDNKQKTTIGAQNADLQIVKYNANAQPHYCLVDQDGNLLVAPKNYDLNPDHFVQFLDSGKSKLTALR
ncbi:MAG: thioredoxin family protein [Bacteroidetes bacterium]|nr:thioredoxin family protein [Fibrella sp.]